MANIEDLRDRSVSSGTLKSEDLIPKFLGVLKTYGKDKYDKYIKENPEVEDWKNLDEETMGWVVDELTDLLNEIAPDGCYFGASDGDGADFGFWSMSNESKKSEVSSLAAFDIEDVVGKKLGWTWDDDKSCLVDKDGTEVDWDESDCITIDPVEDEEGNVLTQVNMWGDGTVEFQDENGESVNWTEFDDAIVKKVVAALGGKSESKKAPVQEDGNKDIFTLDLTRIDADGDEEGLDDMQAAQTFYDEDDAIKAAKELADSYKDDDDVVQVTVMAGEQEKPNGDIVGEPFDIFTASSSDSATTAKYREKAGYTKTDGLDYYAKGGKSEAYEDIWRGADVMTHDEACEQLDYVKEIEDDIISEYGEDYYEDPDAVDEYNQRIQDYIDSCFEQDFVSINGEEIPLGISRDPKLLIVLTDDTEYGDEAVELVKKLANGELTGSSDDGDYVAIMDGVHGSPHFDIYSEGGKSEGNDDDKGCKGKDCKDDKTKKNEADATFKVGDFVNYDAESDGKADLVNPMVYAEVSSVNDDGTLDLWVRDYDDGGKEVKGADTQFCDKLDHFAGMTDADHYYTGGRLNLYAGYYEIFITDKKLGKPYVFSGTIDDLGEKDAVDIYYDTISFVDKSLEDECRDWAWFDENDPEGVYIVDMSDKGNPVESKQTEAKKKYYGYGKDDAIDKEDTDFMWQVAYDWFEDRLPEKLKRWASTAVISVIDKDSRAYEEIVTMDDYHAYLQKYGPSVIKDIKANDESKQTEGLPPKKLGNRLYRSRADLINKMKTLDAVEITTPAQFNDIHSKQWLHTAGYALDTNGNLVGQTYFGDKDGKWYYATTKTFQGDYLPECKEEAKKSEKASVTCSICGNPTDDPIWGEGNRAFCKDCYSDGDDFKHGKTKFVVGMMISLDGVKQYIRELKPRTFVGQSVDTGKEFSLPISSLNRASILYDPRNESKKSEAYNWIAFYFCKDKRTGTEYAVIPQDRVFVVGNGGGRYNLSYLDANGHWDRLSYGYFATSCEPISDPENSKVYATVKADEDRRIIALTESEFDTIVEADDAVKTVKSIVANNYESKKSESLTLKQKELKDMARFGQAEDITTISDEEAKALRKKGIETIGVSRGTYGMNGALLRDNEGKKYVITARSSNLFYFV